MNPGSTNWGIVSTIKAPAREILEFAAFHLEAGAHRLFLYLDAPCPEALPFLRAHPKIRVFNCNDAFWAKRSKNGRPQKHQVRQTKNASRTYNRQSKDLDWLAHIDVDEFLWSSMPIADLLEKQSPDCYSLRVQALEALAGAEEAFKAHLSASASQDAILAEIYPRFASYLNGGFLSHTQGKLFVRCGLEHLTFRIHNAYFSEIENPGLANLPEVDLCHLHASDWEKWFAHYRYRLEKGSYRAELAPPRRWEKGSPNLHMLLKALEEKEGQAGLRAFFAETCEAGPALRERLQEVDLLRIRPLDLVAKRKKHFPDFP
ncbi:hypothetical protein RSK20926_16377 [Roseobacter sp. SK209-2-6]|uniref:glycosyltransferase family 2 protein n=1 Tax=Roseobacter sp. SK209-2-6 TaxID=388739 RepID=UPI0000F3CF91|nr:glycosyltransferase family 2 protein [Roseobacter sp. SK209-2-6]EBA15250.1 hypothetical protein RSK20926_16377 [Roseobacter sp. SK209-2-6]